MSREALLSRAEFRVQAGAFTKDPRHALGPVSFTAGVVVGITIILTVAAIGGVTLFTHTVCVRGEIVANVLFWTPFNLVNAPYLGSTVYYAHFMNWGLFGWTNVTIGPPGSLTGGNISTGYFETQNWTVYAQSNQSLYGPGVSQSCKEPFDALMSHTFDDTSVSGEPLQGPGNTSNANEPTTFSYGELQTAAVFANGFVSSNQPNISTCGTPAKELNFSSTSFDISLTVSEPLGSVTTIVAIASEESYTYYFPANNGTWLVDDLQLNAGLQGPGLAFSWQPC
jgi:hypothetical protein